MKQKSKGKVEDLSAVTLLKIYAYFLYVFVFADHLCGKCFTICTLFFVPLRAMFLSEMSEAKQELIEIKDFDGDAIQDLVQFAYSSKLTLTVDNVQPLLYAACILQVENVKCWFT